MASIERTTTGSGETRYKLRYRTPDGKSREQWFKRRRDAERRRNEMEYAKATGAFADPVLGRRTFGDWWAAWRGTRVDLRPSTRARDDSYYRTHIEGRFGPVPIARIDRTMLREWVAELTASGLSAATVHKAVQLVSKCLATAVDERLIATNPAERLPLPKVESEAMKFLTPNEVTTLADSFDQRYRTWVYTAAYSGLRLGELLALRCESIDPLRRRVDVLRTTTEVRGQLFEGPPKTRAGRRSVPIPAPVIELLIEHCAGMAPDELVFTAPAGGQLRAGLFRRRFFVPATVKAGLGELVVSADGRQRYRGLRIHDLRHTAVTFWIAAGASPKEVATWAGHSSVATVLDRYGHLLPGHEDRVTDALELMLNGASSEHSARVVQLSR